MLLTGVVKHRERHLSVSLGTETLVMEAVPQHENHTTLSGCVKVECLTSAKCSYPKKKSVIYSSNECKTVYSVSSTRWLILSGPICNRQAHYP